jgi:hypothetical protein
MKGQGSRDLTFTIFICDAIRNMILLSVSHTKSQIRLQLALFSTAMDAYEFPKLIPTTGGTRGALLTAFVAPFSGEPLMSKAEGLNK